MAYEQKIYKPTPRDIDELRELLRIEDKQKFQIGIQGWYLRTNPITGKDEKSFRYPNRTTPRTTGALLEWMNASADLALSNIEELDDAGLPLITPEVGQEQLRSELQEFTRDLDFWTEENNRGQDEFRDLEGGDLRWRQNVMGPVFFGVMPDGKETYPQFMRGWIVGDAAAVGTEALDDATAEFWRDMKGRSTVTAKSFSLAAAAAVGVIGALLLTRRT